jgi:phage protein D
LANSTATANAESFKRSPDFLVLGLTPRDGIVKSIYVEETCGFELPIAKIVLGNVGLRLSSTILAKEQSAFRVQLGWTNPGLEDHGSYIVQRPKFRYATDGSTDIEILGYGEAVKIGATQRREVYKKMRDSDIAEMIARRNGFEADVDRTDLVHDQVIQANESDYKFLAKRAKLHGFLLSVVDGVLCFQRPRPCDSGLRFNIGGVDNENGIVDLSIRSRTFMRGARLTFSQIDPITKEQFEISSSEAYDPVQRNTGVANWQDLVSIDGIGQPERFITNEGHEQRRSLWRDQISRMAEAQRYVIAGSGSVLGSHTLRPGQLITLDGVGRSDGRYFVTRVMHTINVSAGYRTRFEIVRAGAGELNSEIQFGGFEPTVVDLESEGTVAL